MLCRFILFRLNQGRDVKILIIARSGATGTGKTTLGTHLNHWIHSLLQCPKCRYKNEHGELVGGYFPPDCDQCPWCGHNKAFEQDPWDADDQAYIDVMSYCRYYAHEADHGTALLLDEGEVGADSRRSMANENVKLSHYWSALRFKNVVSTVTMPSMLQVDKRMEELADVLINVQRRGLANIQWLWLNDMKKEVQPIYVRNEYGHREQIDFKSLDGDPEYEKVSAMKEDHFSLDGDSNTIYNEDDFDEALDQETREMRIKITKELWNKTDLHQGQIGDIVEHSQQWVSKAVNDKL